jgi:hypothetical protein
MNNVSVSAFVGANGDHEVVSAVDIWANARPIANDSSRTLIDLARRRRLTQVILGFEVEAFSTSLAVIADNAIDWSIASSNWLHPTSRST